LARNRKDYFRERAEALSTNTTWVPAPESFLEIVKGGGGREVGAEAPDGLDGARGVPRHSGGVDGVGLSPPVARVAAGPVHLHHALPRLSLVRCLGRTSDRRDHA
jgi:hypothetical protein